MSCIEAELGNENKYGVQTCQKISLTSRLMKEPKQSSMYSRSTLTIDCQHSSMAITTNQYKYLIFLQAAAVTKTAFPEVRSAH